MTSGPLPRFHLAIPVHDIEAARQFYGDVLGFGQGRSAERWTDWNVDGHQVVTHQVDDHSTPWRAPTRLTATRCRSRTSASCSPSTVPGARAATDAAGTDFVIEPYVRFEGEPGEQWTMFFLDPSGNALEFKAFRDLTQLFAV